MNPATIATIASVLSILCSIVVLLKVVFIAGELKRDIQYSRERLDKLEAWKDRLTEQRTLATHNSGD